MHKLTHILDANPALKVLALLFFLIALRGSEGLAERLTIDSNDSIVFAHILNTPDYPETSISAMVAQRTQNIGLTLWPSQVMNDLGLSSETQFFVFYGVQMCTLALGLMLFFSAFGRSFGLLLLAALLCYLSAFSGFGRYLTIGAGFKIVSSGFAMTIGFGILGLHLLGRRKTAAILAALLAAYHPSHGIVLLFILGTHALLETYLYKTLSFASLMKLGALVTFALLPFLYFVLMNITSTPYDPAPWWDFVFSKTSNLTPLQDGLMVVAGILATFGFGLVALRALAKDEEKTVLARRAATILYGAFALWFIQILFTQFIPVVPVAQLALTRVTPYAVLVIIALLAFCTHRAYRSGTPFDRFTATALVLGAIGAALPTRLAPFGLPTITPPIIDTNVLFQSNVVEQASIALLAAVLAWWMWIPHLDNDRRTHWTKILRIGVGIWIVFMGLRLPSLAAALILLVDWRPAYLEKFLQKMPDRPVVWIGAITLAALLLFVIRAPWSGTRADSINTLVTLVETHVPQEGMVLVLPWRSKPNEVISPTRATFLGYGESQYLLYAPALADEIWKRARLVGMEPLMNDPECKKWIWKPMCRRQLFAERARAENDIWRENLKTLRTDYPALTHVLMPQSMACANERVTARANDLVLIAIGDVREPTCRKDR